jgi:hypothetical protein
MKLQELLKRFYFDLYFVDYHESTYLEKPSIYTHDQLLEVSPNIKGEYHIEVVDMGYGKLRLAICSNENTLDGRSAIAYIETEISYQQRIKWQEEVGGVIVVFRVKDGNPNLDYSPFNTSVLNSWNPLKDDFMQDAIPWEERVMSKAR